MFFVFQWCSMLKNYVEVEVGERKLLEYGPSQQQHT
jgi:hypothetical protein